MNFMSIQEFEECFETFEDIINNLNKVEAKIAISFNIRQCVVRDVLIRHAENGQLIETDDVQTWLGLYTAYKEQQEE